MVWAYQRGFYNFTIRKKVDVNEVTYEALREAVEAGKK